MAIARPPRSGILITTIMVVTFLIWMQPKAAQDEKIEVLPQETISDLSNPKNLELTAGKAVVLKSSKNLTRVSEPDPDVAKALLLSPNEVYISPKGAGTTNLILWQDGEVAAIYELTVSFDLSRLKERLHEVFPDEKELRVMSTNDSITLSGRVSSSANMDQIMALTEAFAPKEKIRNLVKVGG
ncbi:MAG: pilus assembly protein N-terminal domain-containing protein, partial [Desulfovermiculus sp.]